MNLEKNNGSCVENESTDAVEPEVGEAKYELVVEDKTRGIETRHPLEEGNEIIVGADPQCGVFVEGDEYISSRHFSIKLMGDRVEVKDIGSKNKLFLLLDAGPVQVSAGQVLLAGKTLFKVEVEENGQI